MNKKDKKDLLQLKDEANKILRDFRDKGNDIAWGLLWLEDLNDSILKKDFVKHNKAFIWFKNAKRRNKEFSNVYDIVNKMTSKIYIK